MDFTIFFDNPIIFIILVAVISSLFRKKKESSRDPKGNQPLEKRRSQTPTYFDEVREVFKEVSRSFSNPTASSNQKRENPYYEEKKVEELNEPIFIERENEPLKSDPPLGSVIQEKAIEVDGSKIVDAIIWTEILGPPRSKKPYMKK